ncbi:MAG: TniQ family protein [Pseudonocardiaceae bacterium]
MSPPRHRQRRWPRHPLPGPVEALSSWLARVAALYGLSVPELLRHNLGAASVQISDAVLADLDWDPPAAMLAALAERTGVEMAHLQAMTIAGWVPWLTDTLTDLDAVDAQELFDTYVRQHSVLLSAAGRNEVHRWRGPWLTAPAPRWERRVCPVCAADPERGTALMWRLPIMVSCVEHACRLEPALEADLARLRQIPLAPTPVGEHVAALDRRTYQGLTTGRVTLPGRSTHVGVWFRLLRTLLDELSTAHSRVGVRSRAALEHIWSATGQPVRAGLQVWRPFEQLDWPTQRAMLEAAAVALHLVETGAIAARGTLGPLLAVEPHRPVDDGDRPCHQGYEYHWARAREAFDAALALARVDPGTAQHLLRLFTRDCATPARVARERQCLIDSGIPARFLPVPAAPTPSVHSPVAAPDRVLVT